MSNCINVQINLLFIIVTSRGERVTEITDSSSNDWIYWHFGYKLS
jgi:hypothetical protein